MATSRRWDRAAFEIVAPDIARGLRAALVMLVPFYLATSLGRPSLSWTALGGWLGTLSDPGGPRKTRAVALVAFALVGGALVALAEPLAPSPWLATCVLSFVVFFLGLLRSFGGGAGGVGTFLSIVLAIACGRKRTGAVEDALGFFLGALLALVVSSILWPIWTHLPVRRAVARVYDQLAAYMEAVTRAALERTPPRDARWTSLMRDHHRRIRASIETARDIALSLRARRQGETEFGGDVRALLGVAEGQFPLLSALVVELESLEPEGRLAAAAPLGPLSRSCREIQRILVVRDIRPRLLPATPPQLSEAGPIATVALAKRLVRATDQAKKLAFGLAKPSGEAAESTALATPRAHSASSEGEASHRRPRFPSLGPRLRVLRDAVSPQSPFFHHALRTALAVGAASALGERLSPSRAYWVTLTTLAILQPYAGATMKRASERVAGTVLGSLVALVVMTTVRSPIGLSALMVPLSVAAVATRPRSYRLFTFFLTPVFVLLAERATGDVWVAATRAGDAVLGGAVALCAGVLVAPASERVRMPNALGGMLDAVAAYAAVVLQPLCEGESARDRAIVTQARRAAGMALGDAETSLERFLAEPLRDRDYAAGAMLIVTYSRRLATALTSFDTLAGAASDLGAASSAKVVRVAGYVASTLGEAKEFARGVGAASGEFGPPRTEMELETPLDQALDRVANWTSLLAGVVRDRKVPDGSS